MPLNNTNTHLIFLTIVLTHTQTLGFAICGNFCGPNWCDAEISSECSKTDDEVCLKQPNDCDEWAITDGSCADACCKVHDSCCGSYQRHVCNDDFIGCLDNCEYDSNNKCRGQSTGIPVHPNVIKSLMRLNPYGCCGSSCNNNANQTNEDLFIEFQTKMESKVTVTDTHLPERPNANGMRPNANNGNLIPTIMLRNGIKMPVLAIGVGGVKAASNSIHTALQIGFNSIDTAYDYGNFAQVKTAIENVPRDNFFLTTKVPGCGVPTQGLKPPCYNNTLKLSEASLEAMHVQYVDLLLLHFPPLFGCKKGTLSCTKMQQQWKALENLYQNNKTRAIGVSNYCTDCIECILETATIKPMVNQMETHIGMPSDNHGLRPFCKTNDIVVEAYSPLGHGKVLDVPALQTIATAKNKSTAQIALRYVLQLGTNKELSPFVTSSSNPIHLKEDLDVVVGGWFLSEEEMMTLENVTSPSCSVEAPGGCCSGR